MQCRSVLLPLPEGPMITLMSPRASSSDTPRSTSWSP